MGLADKVLTRTTVKAGFAPSVQTSPCGTRLPAGLLAEATTLEGASRRVPILRFPSPMSLKQTGASPVYPLVGIRIHRPVPVEEVAPGLDLRGLRLSGSYCRQNVVLGDRIGLRQGRDGLIPLPAEVRPGLKERAPDDLLQQPQAGAVPDLPLPLLLVHRFLLGTIGIRCPPKDSARSCRYIW